MQKGILLVPARGEPLFFVEKGTIRAQRESPYPVLPLSRGSLAIKELLRMANITTGRWGMELDCLPYNLYARWRNELKGEIVDVSPIIKRLRMIKSNFELNAIRESGRIVAHVFRRAKDIIEEGMTELEVAALLEYEGRKKGHQGALRIRGFNQEMDNICVTQGLSGTYPSFTEAPIFGIGLFPAFPHGASWNRIKKHLPIVIDYGGGYEGYTTDETRVYVIDKMDETFKRPYEIAREIIEDTASFAKEGTPVRELYSRAAKKVEKERLADYFMGYGEGKVSFLGHGIGLEIDELPVITEKNNEVLQEGMVFAFEPKFVIPEKGVVGIEVDFIVRKGGLERVTEIPIDIIYL